MTKKVSVIIATKNEEENISCLLKSLKKQKVKKLETIVIDNDSTDKTTEIAKKFGAKVFRYGPERSRQRNFGAKKATGDYLAFLDADMELEKDLLSECLILTAEGADMVILSERISGKGFWNNCRALEKSCYLGDDLIEAARIYGKKLFIELGGYDEQLIASEDWDLHQRAKKTGSKIGRTEKFVIHHLRENNPFSAAEKKYYYGRSLSQYIKKHPGLALTQYQPVRLAFLRNIKRLASHPLLACGLFILKSAEYLGGGLGFIRGKLEPSLKSSS